MTRLYVSSDDHQHWIAYTPETGYVIFPAELDGWSKRKQYHGFDPIAIREVPTRLAFNTGFPIHEELKRRSTAA